VTFGPVTRVWLAFDPWLGMPKDRISPHEAGMMNRTNVVGLFLILGAALGFAFGLMVADVGMAAIYGAAGAAIGIVLGAAIGSLSQRKS
jgi:hypothetical protein